VAYAVRPSAEPAVVVGQLEMEAILLAPTDAVMCQEENFLDTACRP
jgi:hypothetical protein